MLKSYRLKIFANKGKLEKLDNLLNFWKEEVQRKIDIFWAFEKIKGFAVRQVEAAYTSQTCPVCKGINKANRVGESFNCISCGYQNHADTVGAMNILRRAAWDSSVPSPNQILGAHRCL